MTAGPYSRSCKLAAVSGQGEGAGHAFISYARSDGDSVDGLQRGLEGAGVRVWRDTADLWPGQDWQSRIRHAITSSALVFIACFSRASTARQVSYQNEELTLAISEMQKRPPDVPWLIPVRFDDCAIPDRDIGGGRTLRSIQRADLFGPAASTELERLVSTVLHILGQPPSSAPRDADQRNPGREERTTSSGMAAGPGSGVGGISAGQVLAGGTGRTFDQASRPGQTPPRSDASALAIDELDLAVHLFAPMDGPFAEQAQDRIRHLWSECGTRFGMTEPVPLDGMPTELPPGDLRGLPDIAVAAARQSPGAGSQVVLRRDHDMLNLSLLLADQDGAGPSRCWRADLGFLLPASGGAHDTGLIGSGLLYLAKAPDPARAGQEAEALLPFTPEPGWQRTGVTAGDWLAAWEVSARDDLDSRRRFVMVARPEADAGLSALAWSTGDAAMPSFARYLLHMAKIRYELLVLARSRDAASLCRDAEGAVAAIRVLTGAQQDGSRRLAGRLAVMRSKGIEMAELSMHLKAMRRTGEIAQANAANALGSVFRGDSDRDFVADDRAVARSLIQRLDDDIAYLAASLEGMREVREMAGGDAGDPDPGQRPTLARGHNAGRPAATGDMKEDQTTGPRSGVAVVLCALNLEYQAVRAHLTSLQLREHPAGTRFEAGELAGTGWQVALAVTGPGNIGAAVIAERAITLFAPDVLLFVGVAGSLKDKVRLGDVVVATRVDAYHGGTAAEDFLARPRTWPAPHRLDQLARELDRTSSWRERLPVPSPERPPEVHFRPIAAGEVVLDSRHSALFAQLRLHNNDAAAIEMEGAGITQAAHFNDSLPALVIRGISDQADGTKAAADREGWQKRAAAHAAAFATALLENLNPTGRPDRA